MFPKFHIFVVAILLSAFAGCSVEPSREATKMKSAADVKISVGESTPDVAPAQESNSASAGVDSVVPSARPVDKVPDSINTPATADTPRKQMTDTAAKSATAPASTYTGPPKFFGRVTVTGKSPVFPPLLAKGAATKDPVCAEEAVPNESAIVSATGGLENVFVYMKKAPSSGVPEPSADPVVFDQVGCVFIPHASIIRIGQSVTLKNSDPVAHNVNIKAFQEAYNNVVPANGSIDHTFRFAERLPASTGCDFHTFMSSWVLPIDHPWATITDKEGHFEIPSLPEGTWEFIVWHEKVGYVERSVKVNAVPNQAVELNFEVPASKLSQ